MNNKCLFKGLLAYRTTKKAHRAYSVLYLGLSDPKTPLPHLDFSTVAGLNT